jgi:hypothetical protein
VPTSARTPRRRTTCWRARVPATTCSRGRVGGKCLSYDHARLIAGRALTVAPDGYPGLKINHASAFFDGDDFRPGVRDYRAQRHIPLHCVDKQEERDRQAARPCRHPPPERPARRKRAFWSPPRSGARRIRPDRSRCAALPWTENASHGAPSQFPGFRPAEHVAMTAAATTASSSDDRSAAGAIRGCSGLGTTRMPPMRIASSSF